MRAFAYIRRSSDRQPLSLGDQRRFIETWAVARGITISAWFEDDALSGVTANDRAGFQALIREVERRGDVDLVLVYNVDRFGRTDNDEAGHYRFLLRQAGAEVVYVAEAAVSGGDSDDLIIPVLQYQKREYVRALSRDTIRGLVTRARKGAWCGGPCPFGYVRELRDDQGRVVKQLAAGERADTERGGSVFLAPGSVAAVTAIRDLWDGYWLQELGIDALRDQVARACPLPPRARAWRASAIHAILRNPVYTGRATYGVRTEGKFHKVTKDGAAPRARADLGVYVRDAQAEPIVVENAHPAIASPGAIEAFLRWEAADLERRRARAPHRRANPSEKASLYLLSGLIRCGRCGFRFCGDARKDKSGRHPQYVCSGHTGSGKVFCARYAVHQEPIETFVAAELAKRWIVDEGALERLEAALRARHCRPANPAARDALRRKVEDLGARMVAVASAIDPEHAAIANAAIGKLKAERREAEVQLERLADADQDVQAFEEVLGETLAVVQEFRLAWPAAEIQRRKELVRCFVAGVVVDPAAGTVAFDLWRLPRKAQRAQRLASPSPSVVRTGSGGGLTTGTTDTPPTRISLPYEADEVERVVARLEGGRFAAVA